MKKIIKKTLCLFVSLQFLNVYADDYDFMEKANSIVQFENTIMLPKQILSLYHTNLFTYITYINTLEMMLETTFNDANKAYTTYQNSYVQLQNIIKNNAQTPSIKTLQDLIQIQAQSKFDSYDLENKTNDLNLIYNKINSSRHILDNYCQITSQKQDPNNFSLNTQNINFNVPIHNDYTKYTDSESFAKDPHANAVGWLSFSTATIGGMASYAVITSTSISSLLSISTASLVFSGPGAVIVIAAAIVGFLALDFFTSHENEKRKAEADARTQQLKSDMLAAQSWYQQNSIFYKPDQFKQVAFDICQNQKTWKTDLIFDDLTPEIQKNIDQNHCSMQNIGGEGSSVLTKKVCEVDEENMVDKTTSDLNSFFIHFDTLNYPKKIQSLINIISQNEQNIETIIAKYKETLTSKFTQDIIQSTQQLALSNSKLAQGIDAYNTQIKDKLHKKIISDYISNLDNCFKLSFLINKDIEEIDATANEIKNDFSDELNINNEFYTTELPADVEQYKSTYLNDINLCKKSSTNVLFNNFSNLNNEKTEINNDVVTEKTNDLEIPISFTYKDNVTDYNFSFNLNSVSDLNNMRDGLFLNGQIGYFNSRDNKNVKDEIAAANISAFEFDKISWALYSKMKLNSASIPFTSNLISEFKKLNFQTTKPNYLRIMNSQIQNSNVVNLNLEIDNLQQQLSLGLNLNSLANYNNLSKKIKSINNVNKINFEDNFNAFKKFDILKSSFFYDGVFMSNRALSKPPVVFYSNPTSPEGQAIRELTNLCIANGKCTVQDNIIAYLILIDHYSPNSIFNILHNLQNILIDNSLENLNNFKINFNQEISKSEKFQSDKKILSSHGPFEIYELKNYGNILSKKYNIQLNNYSEIIFNTLQTTMN